MEQAIKVMERIADSLIRFRDSSAQNHFGPGLLGQNRFFTGTPRPGTPQPSYKNTLFVAYNGKQMYI